MENQIDSQKKSTVFGKSKKDLQKEREDSDVHINFAPYDGATKKSITEFGQIPDRDNQKLQNLAINDDLLQKDVAKPETART